MKRGLIVVSLAALLAACGSTGQLPRQLVSQQEQAPDPLPKPATAEKRAKARADLAFLYLGEGRFNPAIEEANKAIEADADYPPAHHALALIYGYIGDTAKSEMHFQHALRGAPQDPDINNSYGWFQCRVGREKEGMARLVSVARNPLYENRTRPWTNAGLCALRLKDDNAAEEYFRQAVSADGSNTAAVYQLAAVSYRKNRISDAKRLVDEVVGRGEPNAETLWLALRVERKLGNREAEASYTSQLRRKHRESPEYQLLIQGRYE